jgi:hypothetical protein
MGMAMRLKLMFMSIAMVTVTTVTLAAPVANASSKASSARTGAVVPLVTCSGHGCDGTDPDATGCAASAITARENAFIMQLPYNPLEYEVAGYIQLRYSKTCRTVWGRIMITDPVMSDVQGFVLLINNNDNKVETCDQDPLPWSPAAAAYTCYTKQLDDANMTSFAEGNTWDWALIPTVQVGPIFTDSY